MTVYLTALIMGITGSLHCAGMCSPLVLAATSNGKAIQNRLIYNSGRILMYALLGGIMGSLGSLLPFENLRNGLAISLGVALLVLSVTGWVNTRIPIVSSLMSKVLLWFKRVFAGVLRQRSRRATFLLGFLNGILPCGLTFAALIVALALGTWKSAAFMIVFGLGTLPVMVGFTGWLHYLTKRFNFSVVRMASVLLFISGCLLITRVFVHQHDQVSATHKHELVDVVLCR